MATNFKLAISHLIGGTILYTTGLMIGKGYLEYPLELLPVCIGWIFIIWFSNYYKADEDKYWMSNI